MSTNPTADLYNHPINQLRSPGAEPHSFSNLPQPNSTPPSSPALIPDEELEEYFNAPITQPPHTFSSPVQ